MRVRHITLIGMSNVGKSATSIRIQHELQYRRVDCDPLVNEKILQAATRTEPHIRLDSIEACATWMGQPGNDNPEYEQRSGLFVQCEREVMLEVVTKLKRSTDCASVIDTCGSVIYTGIDIIDELKAMTHVVYLAANPEYQEALFEKYIAEPKPVVWPKGVFSQAPGENKIDALAKCYPGLLASRDARYRSMAETIIPFEIHRDRRADLKAMFSLGPGS
jgi:shikimate kinase